jgi:lipopolysaccharide export system protein LptC
MTDDLHSRLVAFLKITLPLAALALLSTLFLFSRRIDPEAAIPYAEVDIAGRARAPRITAPAWAGVTDDGAALTVSADEARPGSDAQGATAQRMRAVLEMKGGGTAELTAQTGQIDALGRELRMAGDVVVATSTGWRVTTDALSAALDRTRVASPGAVAATGPAGSLTAGSMLLSPASRTGEYALAFYGGVRLIYLPPKTTADGP